MPTMTIYIRSCTVYSPAQEMISQIIGSTNKRGIERNLEGSSASPEPKTEKGFYIFNSVFLILGHVESPIWRHKIIF